VENRALLMEHTDFDGIYSSFELYFDGILGSFDEM